MMATKRESPVKKTAKRKSVTAAPELTDGAVIEVLESQQSATAISASIDPNDRRQQVAVEAYLLAERRGFTAGNEIEDWVAAEAVVDSRLVPMQVA
jgi:hypothetical protein